MNNYPTAYTMYDHLRNQYDIPVELIEKFFKLRLEAEENPVLEDVFLKQFEQYKIKTAQ